MQKLLGGKKWTLGCIIIVLVLFIGMIIYGAQYYLKIDLTSTQTTFIEGEYSVDGGDWKPIDNFKPINDRFHKIVFRGRLSESALGYYNNNMTISTKNVWYTAKTADGKPIIELTYRDKDTLREYVKQLSDNPDDPIYDKEFFDREYPIGNTTQLAFPETPGYFTDTVYLSTVDPDTYGDLEQLSIVLEVENPYPFAEQSFSDCFKVLFSEANGTYMQLFFDVMPPIAAFLLVCFFGLFLFPVAGFILGKVNHKYLMFGVLCFFWGLFLIGNRISMYLNMWIVDPGVCMVTVTMLNYFFVISVMFYLKSNLTGARARAIANVTATVYILVVIAAVVLQFTQVMDLYASRPYLYMCTALGTLIITVLLFTEVKYNKEAVMILASWTPLTLSILLGALNHYTHFVNFHFYHFGLAITMIYQMVRLVFDLRKQYLESIRYQQMQKELYEAKVSVMVSQIQPHFMYNALTSIAMMCSIDPDTAQEATVTFAKYLRGNMDSLKQTKPIPFDQELEHLKKYLYIEKLRFGKKLNIEYDIQTSDFVLPQLSIQPLVENAVKHGVGMKKQGGTVTIATRETETAFEVIISDDGVGFDTSAEQKDDGRSHVGMENTKRRIKEMCGGEVKIESTVGEGTVATVILPKEGQHNEDTVS